MVSKKLDLEFYRSPDNLRELDFEALTDFSQQIRDFLIKNVKKTGGHLGPNLGVVELTVMLHRYFDSPKDTFVFDTGHQTYVHKILTGRTEFETLRQKDGLTGYASRAESAHDILENSHASASLSWADGIARAKQLRGDKSWTVAVIGDGALTGGMAWEALNNIPLAKDEKLIVIVNDNGRSYSPTVGALATKMQEIRTSDAYRATKDKTKTALDHMGHPGAVLKEALHNAKTRITTASIADEGIFGDLEIPYIGPVDGHSVRALDVALKQARRHTGPVLIHVITTKGKGDDAAESNVQDHSHAIAPINPETGEPNDSFGWTEVVSREIVKYASADQSIVAITAAMLDPVGLTAFKQRFPNRVFDVGIAEQHAVAFAAALSQQGLHPYICLYATFATRAFDQIIFDLSLHNERCTFLLDRAGVTGTDGASHNGIWDLMQFSMLPGVIIATPRDADALKIAIEKSVESEGILVIRYPKGAIPEHIAAVRSIYLTAEDPSGARVDSRDQQIEQGIAQTKFLTKNATSIDVLFDSTADKRFDKTVEGQKTIEAPKVLIISFGPLAAEVVAAAEELTESGVKVAVLSPLWAFPIAYSIVDYASNFDLVVTVEDGILNGGIGQKYSLAFQDLVRNDELVEQVPSLLNIGIEAPFLPTGTRDEILSLSGLDAHSIAEKIRTTIR